MTPLKICSSLVFLIILFSLVSAESFGEIGDGAGGEIEPFEINDWGGSVYNVPISNGDLEVNYGGDKIKYNGLEGELVFSEFGKLVEGTVDVASSGNYVFGNLKLDLQSGSKVIFKDGELSIEDPDEMISPEDIEFINSDDSWDKTNIKLSGDGVDYMGLSEVSLDKYGYYVESPEGLTFDDFSVYGEGKVYFLDSGDGNPNLEVPGAYISVNREAKKFTIGSNNFGDSISVRLNKENNYGYVHDADSDYVAFKAIGGGSSSYLTSTEREVDGFVPKVETAGFFAVDNNGHGFYMGPDEQIYTVPNGNVIPEFGVNAVASTASPVEVHFFKLDSGSPVQLGEYGGAIVVGNDGQLGYGFDPSYILGAKYGDTTEGWRGKLNHNLNYGISNLVTYNYHMTKEGLEAMFGLKISDRSGFLEKPGNTRMMADTLARLPVASRWLKTLEFTGRGGWIAGMASGSKIWLYSGGSNPAVFAHELTHTYDFGMGGGFENDWDKIKGWKGPHTWSYGGSNNYEAKATVGEYVFAPDATWQNRFGQSGGQRLAAKVAVLAKWGHIQHYDAARILKNAGHNINPGDPWIGYEQVISAGASV